MKNNTLYMTFHGSKRVREAIAAVISAEFVNMPSIGEFDVEKVLLLGFNEE